MSDSDQESDIEVIAVKYRPDQMGGDEYDYESGYGGFDAAGDLIHVGLDPNGFARDKTEQVLNSVGVRGDINYAVIGQVERHTHGAPTLEEGVVDYATDKVIEKASENIVPGIGPVALGVSDYFNFKSAHKEMIRDMANRNIDGFACIEKDIDGDGKVDIVYIDGTSVLQRSDNEPVYYIEDGKIFTPDEIEEFAENVAWNVADDLYIKAMDAVEAGKNPNVVYSHYLKEELEKRHDYTDGVQVALDSNAEDDLGEYIALEQHEAVAEVGTSDIVMSDDASNPGPDSEHVQTRIQQTEINLTQL